MHFLHECHEIKIVQEPIENLTYQDQFSVEIFIKSQKFNTYHTFKGRMLLVNSSEEAQ